MTITSHVFILEYRQELRRGPSFIEGQTLKGREMPREVCGGGTSAWAGCIAGTWEACTTASSSQGGTGGCFLWPARLLSQISIFIPLGPRPPDGPGVKAVGLEPWCPPNIVSRWDKGSVPHIQCPTIFKMLVDGVEANKIHLKCDWM